MDAHKLAKACGQGSGIDEVVLRSLVSRGGEGGVIALDKEGNVTMPFNTLTMLRGKIGPDGRAVVKLDR